MLIDSNTTIEDFHRYDIVGSENVRLTTGCSGKYDWVTASLVDLKCESPVGGGTVRLRGDFVAARVPTYDLTLEAEKVPLASVVRLLRQAKKQIPIDLTATGLLNAEFRAARSSAEAHLYASSGSNESFPSPQWTGRGAATNVHLLSNSGKDEFALGTVPLTLGAANFEGSELGHPKSLSQLLRTRTKERETSDDPGETFLRIGAVPLAMNGAAPVTAGGWISAGGYRFFLRGDIELKDLFRLENALGLPLGRPAVEGSAKLDVSVSGPWHGFATPSALGSVQLREVRAEMHGLNTPIEISSASVTLNPDVVLLQNVSAHTGNTRWTGTIAAPRNCGGPGGISNCGFQFDLTADELSSGDLAEWFAPHSAKSPWYRILNSAAPDTSPLLSIQAYGKLHVGRFAIKKMVATQVAAQVGVDRGNISLTDLRAQVLQGTHVGNWTIALQSRDVPIAGAPSAASNQAVRYHGTGTLQNISLAQIGGLMNDPWIAGTADGTFNVDASGQDFRELLTHSDGTLQFVMRDGSLPHVQIPGSLGPLPVHRFAGELGLQMGIWGLSAGRLESRNGIYRVKGTASADSAGIGLDFVLTRGNEQSWSVTGTLAKPHVALVDRTEAKRTEATDAKAINP
jgi:hypothetical protein